MDGNIFAPNERPWPQRFGDVVAGAESGLIKTATGASGTGMSSRGGWSSADGEPGGDDTLESEE